MYKGIVGEDILFGNCSPNLDLDGIILTVKNTSHLVLENRNRGRVDRNVPSAYFEVTPPSPPPALGCKERLPIGEQRPSALLWRETSCLRSGSRYLEVEPSAVLNDGIVRTRVHAKCHI